MKINHNIAYPIVHKLSMMMDYNINIMDDRGVIVASSDENRIDSIHEGALEILKSHQPFIIYSEDTKRFIGTKPGVNLPIEFMGEIVGVVGITGDPNELMQLTQMTKITVELMLQQDYMQKQTQFNQQLVHSWVMELINPDSIDEKKLTKNAKHLLHIDPERKRAVLLIEINELEICTTLESLIKKNKMVTEIFQRIKEILPPEKAISTFIDDNLFFIGMTIEDSSGVNETHIAEKIQQLINDKYKDYCFPHIGIGNNYSNIEGLRRSFTEAKQCLSLIKKFHGNSSISHINEWGLIRIIDHIQPGIRQDILNEYPISKLSAELIKTLEELFENDHNLAITAKKLHIHRNTLTYRLESIHQILRLNPKSVKDSTMLLILMILNNLEK